MTTIGSSAPRPDFSLTPAGVLADTVGTTAMGERVFTAQSYDRAESIYIRVSDDTGEQFFSEPIVVRPAPVSVCELVVEDLPGQPLDRPLRPAEVEGRPHAAHDEEAPVAVAADAPQVVAGRKRVHRFPGRFGRRRPEDRVVVPAPGRQHGHGGQDPDDYYNQQNLDQRETRLTR